MCNDQVFDWLLFFCSILNLPGVILIQSANISQQKINLSKVKLTKTSPPPCFLLSLITLDFKYLFCCLPWSQGHKLAIDPLLRCFMSVHSVYVCVCAKNNGVCAYTALFVSVKSRGAHTHTSQWWLVRIIRTSNEMWWMESVYLTNADDQCPWST